MSLADELRAERLPSPERRRQIRQESGATIRRVANEIGVDTRTILHWEDGKGPSARYRPAYARLLSELEELG